MAATVDPIHLFPVKRDAYRFSGLPSQQRRTHFMGERVGFAAEPATNKGTNDVDLVHGDIKHGGQGTVGVMRYLLRRVQLQTPVRVPMSHHGVRFGEPVVNAFHGPRAVRGCSRRVDQRTVTELLEHALLNVGSREVVFPSPVNGLVDVFEAHLRVEHRFKDLPFDVKQRQGFDGRGLINRSNTCDQITDVANLLDRHGVFVLGDRQNTESMRSVLAGSDGHHAWQRLNTAGVDGFDASVMVR